MPHGRSLKAALFLLREPNLHLDVATFVGGGEAFGEVLKATAFVEADGRFEFAIRFEKDAAGPASAGFSECGFDQHTADAVSLISVGDTHLDQFKAFAGVGRDEGAGADGLTARFGDEDGAAGVQDMGLRMKQGMEVFFFHAEIALDPRAVEGREGGSVRGLKGADGDRRSRLHERKGRMTGMTVSNT